MIITKVEEFKKDRFKIFIDEEFAFVLYKGELKSYGIKLDCAISENTYLEITQSVIPKRAKLRAMKLLEAHMYTEKMLRLKLKDNGYKECYIDAALDYVKSYKYVDDFEYARQYILGRVNKKSKIELKKYLYEKGIKEDVFENAYLSICEEHNLDDNSIENDLITKYIIKKLKTEDFSDISVEDKNKTIKYLLSKGFSYSAVEKCFSSLNID